KLIVRRLLEPALQLPERVKLVCLEDKEDALLAELAMHSLDVVLSDAPLRAGLSVKAYSHLLGECGITFFAVEKLAGNLREKFPLSLHEAPMLLPMKMTALRGALERWFTTLSIRPAIAGEFDDSALLNVFGQEGDGVFVAPTVIEPEMLRQHKVQVVGRTQAVKERYYAISVERIIKHPAVAAILEAARHNLFMTK
ncbi:MAG: LysR substrate-binding domain-containing protein, partial [Desulfobulbaceae bacterium]|nr:LysR substrate-binding domain-containing protein [Desulfobulbaceae bacterium]